MIDQQRLLTELANTKRTIHLNLKKETTLALLDLAEEDTSKIGKIVKALRNRDDLFPNILRFLENEVWASYLKHTTMEGGLLNYYNIT